MDVRREPRLHQSPEIQMGIDFVAVFLLGTTKYVQWVRENGSVRSYLTPSLDNTPEKKIESLLYLRSAVLSYCQCSLPCCIHTPWGYTYVQTDVVSHHSISEYLPRP